MVSTRLGVILFALAPVATSRCPKEEPVVTDEACATELADVQSQLDDLTAACTPGPIPAREGGVLVSDDAGAVLSVPPGALSVDTTFTITPLDTPAGDVVFGSALYDISGNEVTTLDDDVTICLSANAKAGEDACLGYLDESTDPPTWKCQDECLKEKNDLLCGNTDHFTNFAILLTGGGGGGDKCNRDDNYILRREGGVAHSEDGAAFVSVLPGALEADTQFTIVPGTAPKADVARISDIYTFGPAGLKFGESARVCLDATTPDTKAGCLGFIDETVDPPKWVCQDPCVKRVDNTLCGKTDHFTSFAILLNGGLSDVECAKR
jgi:hypothetical protein